MAFALAFTPVLRGWWPQMRREFSKPEAKVFRDLGSLLCASVMVWAYLQYGQLIIMWTGWTKREMPWYLHRSKDGWQWITAAVVIVHFAVPFAALLFRGVKDYPRRLAALGILLLLTQIVVIFWMIDPSFEAVTGPKVHWLDAAALAGLGAVWLAAVIWRAPSPREVLA
jgi:hypothetical protein